MTLTGDGGDELFMGYGAYDWANRLSNPVVQTLRKPIAMALSQMGNTYKRGAGVFNFKNRQRIKSHIFSQEQYFFSEEELDDIVKPGYSAEILFDEAFGKLNRKLSAAEEQALYDVKYYLKDDLLVKVDIATMQFSLEARSPFLDYRIVEFALNLSEGLKKKDGIGKYLLKEVLYDYVPRQFFERPKWGFSIPLYKWLKTDLHYLVDKYLSEEMVTKYAVVHPQKVKQLLSRFEMGEDFLYNRIWVLILLHKWMNDHAAN
jgi:asparagine synthase (glutamine-hydrolysing)